MIELYKNRWRCFRYKKFFEIVQITCYYSSDMYKIFLIFQIRTVMSCQISETWNLYLKFFKMITCDCGTPGGLLLGYFKKGWFQSWLWEFSEISLLTTNNTGTGKGNSINNQIIIHTRTIGHVKSIPYQLTNKEL